MRANVDIESDIHQLFNGYPPLRDDRFYVSVTVADGRVTLGGHVKSPMTRRYLLDHVKQIAGVESVEDAGLFDDDTIRFDVGRVMPPGVQVNVERGVVVLSGHGGDDVVALLNAAARHPGVVKVMGDLK